MFTENVETTLLSNGIRVVSETVPYVQSVSIGIWVGVGSRDETPAEAGITHFIEHMLFKGTHRRTARDIASEIESRGGSLNAFTDKEYTCYYAKALAEDAPIVLDVLADMLTSSALDPSELALERNVVMEEIRRYEDTPDDAVHDLFAQTLWPRHPLGKPIAGTVRTVAKMDRDAVLAYMAAHYTPARIVVSAAGNIAHADVVALAERMLGGIVGTRARATARSPRAAVARKEKRKRTEQVHFCLGSPAYSQTSPERYAFSIVDLALGGNMSSRLFQEIREKRGLVYSIGSYAAAYEQGGYFSVYGGTSPQTYDEVLRLTHEVIASVRENGLDDDEIARVKTQYRGMLVLGLENMSARMMRMGKSLLTYGRVVPLDEVRGLMDAVTPDDVRRVARQVLDPDSITITAVGPFGRSASK